MPALLYLKDKSINGTGQIQPYTYDNVSKLAQFDDNAGLANLLNVSPKADSLSRTVG